MRAFLKNNRQAPRKVRLIARAVVGKNVAIAIAELSMMPHKGARTIKKLIESAAANARQTNSNIKNEDLLVKNITVDKGSVYVRFMPRAFGRATPLRHENSHINVTLDFVDGKKVEAAPVKEEKTEKKKVEKEEAPKKEEKKETKKEEVKEEKTEKVEEKEETKTTDKKDK